MVAVGSVWTGLVVVIIYGTVNKLVAVVVFNGVVDVVYYTG